MSWQYDLGHSKEHYERQAIETERTTATGTRTLILTREQIRLISQWANNAWHDADQNRLMARINSPQEASHLADQAFIETITEKLRNVS